MVQSVLYDVQSNHLHLLCEANDERALSRGVQGLAIRIARRLNAKLGRRGKLFATRYHERILETPTEVRRALVYVLGNARRHASGRITARNWIDPLSSAPWFAGWRTRPTEPWFRPDGETPVVAATTWLLDKGWRLAGGSLDPGVSPNSVTNASR
jgi:putative transposase